jgi:hypothetical protein
LLLFLQQNIISKIIAEERKMNENGGENGCFGCLATIVFFVVLWGLIFGVTIGGVHHALSCNTDDGVVIEKK